MNNRYSSKEASGNTAYCGFTVGQHVVCVAHLPDNPDVEILTPYVGVGIGRVYTVRALSIATDNSTAPGAVLVKLEEIPDQRLSIRVHGELATGTLAFSAEQFRPLQKLTPEQFMTSDAPVDGQAVPA